MTGWGDKGGDNFKNSSNNSYDSSFANGGFSAKNLNIWNKNNNKGDGFTYGNNSIWRGSEWNKNTGDGRGSLKSKIKDWQPIGNLSTMIGVQNLPFFGQQAFMGKTIWDWFKRSKSHLSDNIDRLNCHIVPMFLIFFVTMISANIFGAFGMEPMRCLRSPELNDEEREYALDYCMSKNTYYVAPEEGIPWSNKERRVRQLGYYHWVPIMMFLQAMLFMLPNWLWNSLNQQSGIDFLKFIEESSRLKTLELSNPERPTLLRELQEKIAEWLYVFIKTLYMINVTAQFFILNSFIGSTYRWWGIDVLNALLAGENWQDSPIFPRLTLCDVPIRRLGDTPRYTLQCHLRINTYNEKIYLFIWWGFLLVLILTLFNFCYYLIVLICLPCTQVNSVRHLLKQDQHEALVYSAKKKDRNLIKSFAEDALCNDGIILFWFIEGHAGPIIAREILGEIFEYYKGKVHYEDDGDNCIIKKSGKRSFSSQSTGSMKDYYV